MGTYVPYGSIPGQTAPSGGGSAPSFDNILSAVGSTFTGGSYQPSPYNTPNLAPASGVTVQQLTSGQLNPYSNPNTFSAPSGSTSTTSKTASPTSPGGTPPGGGGGSGGGSGGSGGGGSGATSGPTAAQLAAQANYNNLYTTDQNAINTNIGANAQGYNDTILGAYNGTGGFGDRQSTLNADTVQNELSRDQGMQGVRDMVNNGIQGGGVLLDNDGAGTSSAGEALARAYGIEGRQQASNVGRQYAEGQNTIGNNQGILRNDENYFNSSAAPTAKTHAINDIVQSATQALTYLNLVAGQTANPSQVGNIVDQINQVKARATAALTAYDHQLADQQNAHSAIAQPDAQAKAQQLFSSGTAPATPFNFTSSVPAELQNTGPAASSLPIFIAPSNKNNLPQTA